MSEDIKASALNWAKEGVDYFRNLLIDIENSLESKDEIQKALGVNYMLVIDECFKVFKAKIGDRFDELEKKGILKRKSE